MCIHCTAMKKGLISTYHVSLVYDCPLKFR